MALIIYGWLYKKKSYLIKTFLRKNYSDIFCELILNYNLELIVTSLNAITVLLTSRLWNWDNKINIDANHMWWPFVVRFPLIFISNGFQWHHFAKFSWKMIGHWYGFVIDLRDDRQSYKKLDQFLTRRFNFSCCII